MKKIIMSLILILSVTTVFAAAEPVVVNPGSLQWEPAKGLSGAEVAVVAGDPEKKEPFIARVKLPTNFKIPAHMHAIDECDMVVSGKLYLGLGKEEDKNSLEVPAGSFVIIPAHYKHYAWTKEETILQISGIGPWGMIYSKKVN